MCAHIRPVGTDVRTENRVIRNWPLSAVEREIMESSFGEHSNEIVVDGVRASV